MQCLFINDQQEQTCVTTRCWTELLRTGYFQELPREGGTLLELPRRQRENPSVSEARGWSLQSSARMRGCARREITGAIACFVDLEWRISAVRSYLVRPNNLHNLCYYISLIVSHKSTRQSTLIQNLISTPP